MQSFRTELENPIVQKDIVELAQKIQLFKDGKIDDDRFRSLRLARGVYGQRQEGVQMIRIKLPYGKLTTRQLVRICDVSDEYSRGKLHITTRQDIQIHYVSLDRTPQLWEELEKDQITLREACGNTVRNVTGSPMAGVDPNEPFDVSPYAHATFEYFLRNPISQDMGRKFKMAFSSTDADDALTYMHDLGFIAKIKDGERGFKVMLGGGLGSQPLPAFVAYEFLPTNQILPFAEAVVRVFDRYGERAKRNKARLKFLVADLGFEAFMQWVNVERLATKHKIFEIEAPESSPVFLAGDWVKDQTIDDVKAFEIWKQTNVFAQKQTGFVAVGIRVPLGDFTTATARELAKVVDAFAADDIRLTLTQNIVLRFVKPDDLPALYNALKSIGLNAPGYESPVDITACPGTDTCNLGIASSTGLAVELERVMLEEYPQLLHEKNINVKISGCMNACGQHNMADIGFQGMTVKAGVKIAPASQVLLGGRPLGDGQAVFSDKVLKVPSKRAPEALRIVLDDFLNHRQSGETFHAYYHRLGTDYFYHKLTHLSNVDALTDMDFIDWGNSEDYIKAIGVGECAGVVVDLVATLLLEAQEALEKSKVQNHPADAIYFAYNAMLYAGKAILTTTKAKINTQLAIIKAMDDELVSQGLVNCSGRSFADIIYQINQNEPSVAFAKSYQDDAQMVINGILTYRESLLSEA